VCSSLSAHRVYMYTSISDVPCGGVYSSLSDNSEYTSIADIPCVRRCVCSSLQGNFIFID
jgi:hypothetical protein